MVTWKALGSIALALISIAFIGGGCLTAFAASMADNDGASEVASRGCLAAIAGAVGLGLAIWGLAS